MRNRTTALRTTTATVKVASVHLEPERVGVHLDFLILMRTRGERVIRFLPRDGGGGRSCIRSR